MDSNTELRVEHKQMEERQLNLKAQKLKNFSCRTCGNSFSKKIDLHVHRLAHTQNSKPGENINSSSQDKNYETETYWCAMCKSSYQTIHECSAIDDFSFEDDHLMNKTSSDTLPAMKENENENVTNTAETLFDENQETNLFDIDNDIMKQEAMSPISKAIKIDNFKCRVCGEVFVKRVDLHVHRQKHGETSQSEDNESFSQKIMDIAREISGGNKQESEGVYWCAICKSSFEGFHLCNDVGLRRGQLTPKPFECKTCGKCFTANGNLRRHEQTHSDFRPFKCALCERRFSQKTHLEAHQHVHSKERPYTCELCGTSFTRQGNLKRHKRLHTDQKPYRCNTCGKCFRQPGHLKEHQTTHTASRSFDCSVCKKSFTRKGNLKRHMQLHSKSLAIPSPSTLLTA